MARLIRYFKNSLHVVCLTILTYLITHKNLNPVIKKKMTRYLPDMKHILIWSSLPGLTEYGQKGLISKNCQDINCYFTTNRNLFGDLRYFDVIIFNLQEVSEGKQELPKVRGISQKYIFAANNSADNYPICNPAYENFFNWTWTYKTNSTIPYRFISIYSTYSQEVGNNDKWVDMKNIKPELLQNEFAKKHIAAAIFMDKCNSRSKREVFVKQLQKELVQYNMTVDIFGKCGTQQCRKLNMKPCFWKLRKFYYFYLAFEDSMSDDYVTEIVLYAYQNNVVPVVYGRANYDRFLPPGSYIDALALGEAKLAEIMYRTAYDPLRYAQFFKWKTYYTIKETQPLDICTLCLVLNNHYWLTHQLTSNKFRRWWNEHFDKRCEESVSSKLPSFISF